MSNQITGLSGEYFVAAKLLKRNFQVAMTIGTAKAIYFIVYLNKTGVEPTYFILTGAELLERPKHFYGSSLGRNDKRETVNHGPLQEYKNRWSIMEKKGKN